MPAEHGHGAKFASLLCAVRTLERAALLIAAAIVTLAGLSIDTPPFTPIGSQPDYVLSMIERSRSQKDASRIVVHHGQWTKTDLTDGSFHFTTYYSTVSGAKLTVSGQRSVTLERHVDPPFGLGIDGHPYNTGKRQSHLGQTCAVWDVWRTKQPVDGSNISHQGCITDDGILLWEKTLHGSDVLSSVEAAHIERRPVAAEDVRIPRELLTLDWWDVNLPSFDGRAEPDHEVVFELSDGAPNGTTAIMTRRRLGPWSYQDETLGLRRDILITHDSHQMELRYASDDSGVPRRLAISRPDHAAESLLHKLVSVTTDLNRSETILGETCRWFDMMPGTMDAGRSACLTRDGIAVKEVVSGRGMRKQTWTAVRLSRRPVGLDKIKPPAELLEPRLWGLD